MSFECKYVASRTLAPALLERLAAICRVDAEHPYNWVNSVYFDGPDLAAMDEVANGDYLKAKVRVRWYQDRQGLASSAFAECKRKIGTQRDKRRVAVPGVSTSLPLHHPAWLDVPRQLRTIGAELPAGLLQPVLHIRYRRHRFTEPLTGLRLALDDDIRVTRTHPRFVPTVPITKHPADCLVFETKGAQRQLPPTLRFVEELGARRRSFSKYGLWCEVLSGSPAR